MNKKNNRKGFTTVELVIVIAVIAILATVLIPTFSGLIGKANASGALQTARNAQTAIMNQDLMPEVTGETVFKLNDGDVVYICVDEDYWFTLTAGQLAPIAEDTTVSVNNGKITVGNATAVDCETIADGTIDDLPDDVDVYVVRADEG